MAESSFAMSILDAMRRGIAGKAGLGCWLVRQGLALAARRYSSRGVAAEQAARATKARLWRGAFVAPWDWRRGKRLAR